MFKLFFFPSIYHIKYLQQVLHVKLILSIIYELQKNYEVHSYIITLINVMYKVNMFYKENTYSNFYKVF